jgi:acyl carrier protein
MDTKAEQPGAAAIKPKVREFITSNFYVPDSAKLADSAPLLDSGVIDSTGVLEVIAFLEREFGIEVPDRDLLPENLDSIDRITAYVERRKG